jgi:hypothetical protein
MGGPVQGCWCYPIERCLKTIRKKCRNKCKIEASIAEAYILEEVSNFTTTYYGDELQSVHNPCNTLKFNFVKTRKISQRF